MSGAVCVFDPINSARLPIRVILLFLLSGGACSASVSDARALCGKMEDARSRIVNYQCTVEYHDVQTTEARERILAKLDENNPMTASLAKSLKNELLEAEGGLIRKYQYQEIAYSNTGRFKCFDRFGVYDSRGQLWVEPDKTTAWWDNAKSIRLTERGDKSGALISGQRPLEMTTLRNPMRSFGGTFLEHFQQALGNGADVEILAKGDAINLRFTLGDKDYAAVVDPEKEYCVTTWEIIKDGRPAAHFEADFEEVADGIRFPTGGIIRSFFDDGEIMTSTTVKVTWVQVNDCSLNEDEVFQARFPAGTYVEDMVEGRSYTTADPDAAERHQLLPGKRSSGAENR